jgi:hypothetical protein
METGKSNRPYNVLRFLLPCYPVLYPTMAEYCAAQVLHQSDVFKFGGCATAIDMSLPAVMIDRT